MTASALPLSKMQRRSFWQRWFVDPVLAQLRQGITPEKIALTIALGAMLGIFPVIGAATVLCTAAGFALRLNQPVLQLLNYVMYPIQLALILVFVRIGEWVFRAPPLSFSISQMLGKFRAAPLQFLHDFSATFAHCITAWLLIAPVGGAVLYFSLRPLLRAAAARTS